MSYSGYKSSSRGSRGFIRGGGYRGSSRGGGDGWRGGSGRGYSSSSRGSGRGSRFSGGGGKWVRDTSSGSYDSRSRYNSGGERYSSHSREEGSYRYRGDESISSYTSRDHSHRPSSPDRKRMRTEYSPASSMHRSHDYGDGIDSSYSSRSYGGYENKRMSGSYGGEDRRTSLFREERERIRSDDYEFRKPLSVGGPRHSTPRGSTYRGRSFSRGMRGSSGFRRPTQYRGGGGFVRKRTLGGDGFGIRRRIATGKSQEYLRRLKLYRLQRLRRLRDRAERGDDASDDDDDEDDDDLVDDDEEEEVEEEIEEEVTDDENKDIDIKEEEDDKEKKDNEDEEIEEGGDEKKDELSKKKKVKKVIKVMKKVKRLKVPKKEIEEDKDDNEENKEIHVTVKQDSEGRDVDASSRMNYLGEPFIKLECPHCSTCCETFLEYKKHLFSNKHQTTMMEVAVKVRKRLARLRLDQRNEQRELDEECKVKNMKMRTFYCMTCKLNYRSLKSEHLNSDRHNEMKKLLYPVCRVCRMSCKTPMMYENHVCSLDHLKRKHYFDKKNAERQEGNEIDMDKYMVLDQVGSGEEESESESSEKGEEKEENDESKGDEEGEKEEKEKKPKKKKKVVNLGSEYCQKIEVYFCDLCKTFLPRIEDQEQALAVHCRGRNHLHWYVKKRDDIALRKRAERIHRMREEQRKAEIKEERKEDEPMDEDASEDQAKSTDSKKVSSAKNAVDEMDVEVGGMDEKTWSEVDKEMGDILNQVDELEPEPGNKSSDDEEDSRAAGRRYDRFKHSEKGKQKEEDKGKSEEKGVKVEVVNGDDKDDA